MTPGKAYTHTRNLQGLARIWLFCALSLALTGTAVAGFGAYKADVKPEDVFQGAEKFGPLEGVPRAMAAYKNGTIAGYVFETSDIGYSGKPIRILAGLDKDGTFTGAKVVEHHEPILLVGISPDKLFDFVGRHAGRSVIEMSKSSAAKQVDVISGATVTAVVITDGLMRSALAVAKSRGIAGFPSPQQRIAATTAAAAETAVVADIPYEKTTWTALLGEGSVRRLHLLNRDVDEAFARIGVGSPEPYGKAGVPDEDFIDFYAGLISVETIGRSTLTQPDFTNLKTWLQPDEHALLLAANGDYSFRGSGFVRGGIFDRIQIIQEDQTILLKDKDHKRLDHLDTGLPDFNEIGLFRIPSKFKFDPAKGFRVELLAQRPTGPTEKSFTSFPLSYQLPSRFLKTVAVAPPGAAAEVPPPAPSASSTGEMAAPTDALWMKIWRSRALDVAILGFALTGLTLIFFFQDWLVKHRVLFTRLRVGFLLFSVLWLGLYAKAQLSVVNVLTFSNAVLTGFRWEIIPARAADLHLVECHRCVSALLGTRRLLRMALPVRCTSGTSEPRGTLVRRAAAQCSLLRARAPVGLEIHLVPRAIWRVAWQHGIRRTVGGGRAVQDRRAAAFRARVVVRVVRARSVDGRPLCRTLLLQVPLRPGRGARHSGPGAHVRLAEASQAMRG